MYKHNNLYEFSDKEIDQIVELVTNWASGSTNPIDRRCYTDQVILWAKNWNLIELGQNLSEYNWKTGKKELPHYVQKWGKKRYYFTDSTKYDVLHYTPIEALWRLVRPIVTTGTGYHTITHHKDWHNLNLFCASDSFWYQSDEYEKEAHNVHLTLGESRYLPAMKEILNKLSMYGYIIFQYAGSIWQVTITEDRACRDSV